MATSSQPSIRPARPEDLPAIYAMMAAYDMVGEFSTDADEACAACYVAESPHGLVGFARLETVNGCAYLRPIVVDRDSRGQGIGRSLLEHMLQLAPGLTVISRGSAVDFYARSGFGRIAWECIPQVYRDECAGCTDLKICAPIPMQHLQKLCRI